MKRSAAVSCIFSLIFLAGLASAQSLAEIAKKEKEKRESAPAAQKVPIITEDELKRARGGTFSVTGQPVWREELEREPETPDQPKRISGMDEMRERAAAFEDRLATLSDRVQSRDDKLRRYVEACYEKYTLQAIPAVSGYYAGITWTDPFLPLLALANETMPECRGLWSDIEALSSSIREEWRSLEEAARQKGVPPGLMRDLARKYGLDWPGPQ
jgi:hypothetical protein